MKIKKQLKSVEWKRLWWSVKMRKSSDVASAQFIGSIVAITANDYLQIMDNWCWDPVKCPEGKARGLGFLINIFQRRFGYGNYVIMPDQPKFVALVHTQSVFGSSKCANVAAFSSASLQCRKRKISVDRHPKCLKTYDAQRTLYVCQAWE